MSNKLVLLLLLSIASCCATNAPNNSAQPDVPRTEGAVSALPLSLKAVVNNEYEAQAIDMLRGAVQTIRVVHFECNKDETVDNIVHELILAHRRGVKVTVLLEGDVDDNTDRVEELLDEGVEAKLDSPKRYTHVKLFVVDQHKVLLGSTNLSYKSILYNNETNLYVESSAVGHYFAQYADKLWDEPVDTPELAQASEAEIGLKRTLHDGDYFNATHPLVKGATTRIYLIIYGFNMNPKYPDSEVHQLAEALGEARQRGVETRVIIELSDYNDTLNEVNDNAVKYLTGQCVDVRYDPLDRISHAKLLIVDDTAVVGSNNWGYGGFHLYHEVGAVTDNKTVVDKLASYFFEVWEESAPVPGRCR